MLTIVRNGNCIGTIAAKTQSTNGEAFQKLLSNHKEMHSIDTFARNSAPNWEVWEGLDVFINVRVTLTA